MTAHSVRPATFALAILAIIASGCRVNRIESATCTPGQRVLVACGCEGVGSCIEHPNPVIRICDGAILEEDCGWDTQLAENDDGGPTCGQCPGARVVCPPSGLLLVIPRGLYPDEIVECDWAVRPDRPTD